VAAHLVDGPQTGIPNSLAVEFKTITSTLAVATELETDVTIQNCSGTGAELRGSDLYCPGRC
jgi:hypothetical protein